MKGVLTLLMISLASKIEAKLYLVETMEGDTVGEDLSKKPANNSVDNVQSIDMGIAETGETKTIDHPWIEGTGDGITAISEASEKFGKIIINEIKNVPGNILYSPFSASEVLAMLAEGASGETLSIMKEVMYLSSKTDGPAYKQTIEALKTKENFILNVANRIFVMTGFKLEEKFTRSLKENFQSSVG